MINKAKNGEHITVVDDMFMSPTYTKDAASVLSGVLISKMPFGVIHATNKGYCSWYQFAQTIFQLTGLTPDLKASKTDPNFGKARRPLFSALTTVKLSGYNLEPRSWKDALKAYLTEKGHI
jgi:dTDP-4-dehydrorhamnose reductase